MSVSSETGLVRYDAMVHAIVECERVDEAKDIRDKARALELYMAQAGNLEAERLAINVRLRAERKCGQLLEQMKKNGERASVGDFHGNQSTGVSNETTHRKTLSDLGVTRDQASRFQALAGVPEDQFEAALEAPDKPSTSGIIREARAPKAKPIDKDALWLWGRLRDFERTGVINRDQGELLVDMTPAMRDDVRRLAPIVAQWIGGCDIE